VRLLLAAALAANFAAQAAPAPPATPEPPGFWTGPINDPVPPSLQGGRVIHAKALAALLKLDERSIVIVDVSNAPRRPGNLPASTAWLPLPHQAIPGAIWIPGAGLGAPPAAIAEYYRKRLATATGGDLGRPVVVYCHEKCWLSWNGAKRAIQYGYHHVYWFPEGIEGWRRAQLPTAVIEPEPVP
jgi:PQQ-dependent catabolism-associated CXXCW motif protein